MTKIRASKCEIKQISNSEGNLFMDKYHKQHSLKCAELSYGLYYNGELVQVEQFGAPRIEIQNRTLNHDWELLRECSKADYQIYGGKSRLLKKFIADTGCLCLLSYCSLTEGFDGHSYKACGFTLDRVTTDYWWEKDGVKVQRYRMQRNSRLRNAGIIEPIQKTIEYYGGVYNPNETERENAERNGFVRVTGNGQQQWTLVNADTIGFIYEITNKVNGHTYIGQHVLYNNGNWSKNYFGSGVALKSAINKYGKKNFSIKALAWTSDLDQLTELEYKFINEAKNNGKAEYNISVNPYNAVSQEWRKDLKTLEYWRKHNSEAHKGQTAWNKGLKLGPLSEETKKKLSEANKGIIRSESTKLAISNSLKGRIRSDEFKMKCKVRQTGKHLSEETKHKLSEAAKGRHFSEEQLKKRSESRKGRSWWNNGVINKLSIDCPGEGWYQGMC